MIIFSRIAIPDSKESLLVIFQFCDPSQDSWASLTYLEEALCPTKVIERRHFYSYRTPSKSHTFYCMRGFEAEWFSVARDIAQENDLDDICCPTQIPKYDNTQAFIEAMEEYSPDLPAKEALIKKINETMYLRSYYPDYPLFISPLRPGVPTHRVPNKKPKIKFFTAPISKTEFLLVIYQSARQGMRGVEPLSYKAKLLGLPIPSEQNPLLYVTIKGKHFGVYQSLLNSHSIYCIRCVSKKEAITMATDIGIENQWKNLIKIKDDLPKIIWCETPTAILAQIKFPGMSMNMEYAMARIINMIISPPQKQKAAIEESISKKPRLSLPEDPLHSSSSPFTSSQIARPEREKALPFASIFNSGVEQLSKTPQSGPSSLERAPEFGNS